MFLFVLILFLLALFDFICSLPTLEKKTCKNSSYLLSNTQCCILNCVPTSTGNGQRQDHISASCFHLKSIVQGISLSYDLEVEIVDIGRNTGRQSLANTGLIHLDRQQMHFAEVAGWCTFLL